jgi:hypothetical protein
MTTIQEHMLSLTPGSVLRTPAHRNRRMTGGIVAGHQGYAVVGGAGRELRSSSKLRQLPCQARRQGARRRRKATQRH